TDVVEIEGVGRGAVDQRGLGTGDAFAGAPQSGPRSAAPLQHRLTAGGDGGEGACEDGLAAVVDISGARDDLARERLLRRTHGEQLLAPGMPVCLEPTSVGHDTQEGRARTRVGRSPSKTTTPSCLRPQCRNTTVPGSLLSSPGATDTT